MESTGFSSVFGSTQVLPVSFVGISLEVCFQFLQFFQFEEAEGRWPQSPMILLEEIRPLPQPVEGKVVYLPLRVLYIAGGCLGYLPSTVWPFDVEVSAWPEERDGKWPWQVVSMQVWKHTVSLLSWMQQGSRSWSIDHAESSPCFSDSDGRFQETICH